MESHNQNPEQNRPQEGVFDAEQLVDTEKITLGGYEGKAKRAAAAFLLVTELTAMWAEMNEENRDVY